MSNTPTIEQLQAEIAQLQHENAALQQRVAMLQPFQALAERSPDAAIITSPKGNITFANQAYRRIYGHTSDENILGKDVIGHVRSQNNEAFQKFYSQLMTTGQFQGIFQEQRSDGTPFLGSITVSQLADDQGQTQHFIAFFRDITTEQGREERLQIFEQMIENAPDGIAYLDTDSTILYANPAFKQMIGYGDEVIGMNGLGLVDPAQAEGVLEAMMTTGRWTGRTTHSHKDGWAIPVASTSFFIESLGGPSFIGLLVRDITAQAAYEAEQSAIQEQIIMAQQATLRELSTPMIPLAQGIIAMPIVGTIDSNRAQQILEALLEGIGEFQAETAILDLTGVKIMDTQVANALIRAAQAAKLLGADVILSGISAEVAQTLVHLGVDLSTITTHRDLQQSIAAAFAAS